MTVDEFNKLPEKEAIEKLVLCCGSSRWAEKMELRRPFQSLKEIHQKAKMIWRNEVDQDDWREAFTHHPKIGDLESLRKKFAGTKKWVEDEQKGTAEASESVLKNLAEGNQKYEDRFGYIFIVCASGKSAAEMLALLENRLKNDPKVEIRIAADEQRKITEIRLEKLLT